MRTVQMTLDDKLIKEVDQAVERLGTTRSAFARDALREALARLRLREKEREDREGYAKKPAEVGELGEWEDEQLWLG